MACPEGKSIFQSPSQSSKYWGKKRIIDSCILELKEKYNLHTPEDWNSITRKQIRLHGGGTLLNKYSMHQLKVMVFPEEKLRFNNLNQVEEYWEKKQNILTFLTEIKEKYNLNTPEDWNSITSKHIQSNGGWRILKNYSLFELKRMACPEGKLIFKNPKGYWKNKEKVLQFLSEIKEKYNLNTPEDWNSITATQIQLNGGNTLLSKYSLYELKCLACPEGKSSFTVTRDLPKYWESKENFDDFILELKEKYNLHAPEDWKRITRKHIQSQGGGTLLHKDSLFEVIYRACPEYKSTLFTRWHWDKKENVDDFISKLKEKYNLHTPEDWNSITRKQIRLHGGDTLLNKYSILQLKIMASPEGKLRFNNLNQVEEYWEKKQNILTFLNEIKEKYNLNTPEDWNSITSKHIQSNGGWRILKNYSLFELKRMACPEGKLIFKNPKGYWKNKKNVLQFLSEIKEKYNLNTPVDWNSINTIVFTWILGK